MSEKDMGGGDLKAKPQIDKDRKEDIERIMQEFDAGFAAEIKAKMNRIDELVGADHWLSVGAYKERLLKEQLIHYVPKRYEVGTGFLLASVDGKRVLSKQIDLLIWDSSIHSPFFRDGEFVILPPEACRAAIEVKGHINSEQLIDGLTNLLSVSRLANLVWHKSRAWFHTFLFALSSYDNLTFPGKVLDGIHESLLKAPYVVTEDKEKKVKPYTFDFTMEQRHKSGCDSSMPSASLYWPGTIAVLGGGIIRFSRFRLEDSMSGYACVYKATTEQDLTLALVRHELVLGLQAEERTFAERMYNGFTETTSHVMPLPYSTAQKAKIQEHLKGIAVYEPPQPWVWTADDAVNAFEEAKRKREQKAIKKAQQ